MPETYTVRIDDRPFTVNTWRNWHHRVKATHTKRWRKAGCVAAREAQIPRLDVVDVVVHTYLKDRRSIQDTGASFCAYKAALDGIVDAGVLEDDDPRFVRDVTFRAPVIGEGDGLSITLVPVEA